MQDFPNAQATRLRQLIRAAEAGQHDAASGLLFAGTAGLALVNAAFDLFECDALYDLAQDVRSELGMDAEGYRLGHDGEVPIVRKVRYA